jgi:hypothetical protein
MDTTPVRYSRGGGGALPGLSRLLAPIQAPLVSLLVGEIGVSRLLAYSAVTRKWARLRTTDETLKSRTAVEVRAPGFYIRKTSIHHRCAPSRPRASMQICVSTKTKARLPL